MSSSALVYELADSQVLVENAEVISRVVAPDRQTDDENIVFRISPGSGWISFCDFNQLWRSRNADGPMSSAEALAAAQGHIKRMLGSFSQLKGRLVKKLPKLLPDNLEPVDALPVASQTFAGIDHWLCRFRASLYSDL